MAVAKSMYDPSLGPDAQPVSQLQNPLQPSPSPLVNPIPNSAQGITQLSDGVGGAVTVPPPTLAPPNVTTPITPFSQGSNLIGSQINPTGTPRLLGAQQATDTALQNVTNGPDRVALGQQYYNTFAQGAQANFQRALQDATNQAAAHGQIGSGMLTNRYGDLTEAFNRDNTAAASDFATRALEGTIGDRLNALNAARGVEGSIYGEEAGNRSELRGERGYQQSLAEQAIARRIAQQQAEQGQAAQLYGLGNAYDPTSAYQMAAGQYGQDAQSGYGDVGALLRLLAQQRYPVSY